MPKFKITSADGVVFVGKTVPKDTVLDVERGPHTDAWLRFKQAIEVKEEAAEDPDPKGGAGGKKK